MTLCGVYTPLVQFEAMAMLYGRYVQCHCNSLTPIDGKAAQPLQ